MATYLKRTSKLFDISLSRNTVDVTLRDLMCPICRGILIEPVSLPCTHNLCLRCLKGTFEHNSLSCPLCRVRVGSWLRTATKSETLVNSELWELIRTKFPKEVESKYNGADEDTRLDPVTNRILSTAGEIRREYEAQLQMAQEEMLRQREAERIASEALIRKIQDEEQQQQLVQLAQDKILAKSLAKRQNIEKNKGALKYYNECLKTLSPNCLNTKESQPKMKQRIETSVRKSKEFENHQNSFAKHREDLEIQKSNLGFVSEGRINQYVISGTLNVNKDSLPQESTYLSSEQKESGINMAIKHKEIFTFTKSSGISYSPKPSCSNNSKIYGLQSKEELHVPNDVLSSKKKTLDMEICMTAVTNEVRLGSAESGGSHDSINQEIHHFKPIKAMPRTPLLLSSEGKQINPKVIRVIPVAKRVSHVLPQPPSPTRFKKIIACSWSAFNGKARVEALKLEHATNLKTENCEKANKLQTQLSQYSNLPNSALKSKTYDSDCRLTSEISFDSNKNYTKSASKVMNGIVVKLPKKDEKAYKMHLKTSASKKQCSRKRHLNESTSGNSQCADLLNTDHMENIAVENIAERIKRRKTTIQNTITDVAELSRRSMRKNTTVVSESVSRQKREPTRVRRQKGTEKCNKRKIKVVAFEECKDSCSPKNSSESSISEDEEIVKEQERLEKLVLQEKEDFELALRLQAQFDEMERLAGRTRGSRRALESSRGTLSVPRNLSSRKEKTATFSRQRKNTSTRIQRCQPQKSLF